MLFSFFKISDSASLAAPARHDDVCAAADHRDGVHPLQHRQGRMQPLRGLPGEGREIHTDCCVAVIVVCICKEQNFNSFGPT